MKRTLTLVFIALRVILPAAASAQEIDPQDLLDAAVAQLQSASSFRLAIEQSGEAYPLALSFDGVNRLPASLNRADAQVISPDELHIRAQLQLFIPLSMDVYSHGERQWLSFPSGAPWIQLPAFEGFDITRLLAAGDGIEKALTELQDARIVDEEALVDGSVAWHIEATAAGGAVESLLFGLIEPQDDVALDAYVSVEEERLLLIEILMLETVAAPDKEPAVWHIRFYDYDAPRDFDAPEG